MSKNLNNQVITQRQLRVGELVKKNIGEIFIMDEAKIPHLDTKIITVTEVKMSADLKSARVYVIPLGGDQTEEVVMILTEYTHLVRRALSKRLDIKFLPKLNFVEDKSFDYAQRIERLIKENNDNEKKKTDIIKSLQISSNDVGSTAIQIGLLSKKIENLSEHFKKFKKDKHSIVGLNKSVNKRKKLLAYLKEKMLHLTIK